MLKQLLIRFGKKTSMQLLSAVLLFSFTLTTFAQSAKQSKKIGSVTEVYQQLSSTVANGKQNIKSLETTIAALPVVIEVNKPEYIMGKIEGNQTSSVFFDFVDGKLEGKVVIPNQRKAYNYYTDEQGNVFVEEIDINKVICIDMSAASQPVFEDNGKRSSSVPVLNSLPGAASVIMLDFDGHNVTGGNWGTINAASANFADAKIKIAWDVVAEDFRPYVVNVTTEEAVFMAAAVNKRKRCVITPTTTAAPGAGGVAYIGSFDDGKDGNVAWTFNLGGDGKLSGETSSHEVGHTVGLNHDGRTSPSETYYQGHTNKAWGPLMGASYDDKVGHWSKGEYQSANNQEDDLTIIGTKNGFGFRADEAGNTIAAAKALVIGGGGVVTGTNNYGIVTSAADVDVYSFTSAAGQVTLDVKPAPSHPNLDVLLKLTNASGTDVTPAANPTTTMSASITATIPSAGTYYLHIDGTGNADPLTTGWTDYGSIGEYTISGTVPTPNSVQDINNHVSFQAYPNPSNGQVLIRVANPEDRNEIKVTNMVGEVIFNKTSNSGLALVDLTNYPQGIYFISVANSNGTSTVKQIKE